ncbi:hypothetical protein HHK36_005419 [Tetracentron sinense]|uniref:Essential protein Yae1 N-terminal domain-containing protein n=1 Tax=Tetracentron sinense TaxID=13715 RepID=A0A834ZL12_TETSI|nr:hypothetical protein HHK36_005419 [Tetracentron sinense]
MESKSENSKNVEDIFDSSLNIEETHFQDGFKEGFDDGLVSGKQEGSEVGLKVGFEVGEELGFYRGCVDVWNSAIRVDSTCFSSRVQKSIKQMEQLIQKYPIMDPENENVQEIMDSLRLKFRAISATLSMKLEYNGYPKSSEGGGLQSVQAMALVHGEDMTEVACNLLELGRVGADQVHA